MSAASTSTASQSAFQSPGSARVSAACISESIDALSEATDSQYGCVPGQLRGLGCVLGSGQPPHLVLKRIRRSRTPDQLMSDNALRRQRFDALFEAHRVDVASYCSWRSRSRADAEDAVAEVFLVAWRRLELIPPGDGARAWLYATARRVTANARRSTRRRDALQDRISRDRTVDDPRSDAMTTEDALVHEALGMLSERDREVLLLVEWEGLRPGELAEVLGCHEVTARGRLHRARARFRDAFESGSGAQTTSGSGELNLEGVDLSSMRSLGEMRKAQP